MVAHSLSNGNSIINEGNGWVYSDGRQVPINGEEKSIPVCGVCGEKQRIINVDNLPQKDELGRENARKKWGGIPVDACIADEIEHLLNHGIVTKSCCCGHGKQQAECLIDILSTDKAIELGYQPLYYHWDLMKITLEKRKGEGK